MFECVGSLISTLLPISVRNDGNLENTDHYLVYVFSTQKHIPREWPSEHRLCYSVAVTTIGY